MGARLLVLFMLCVIGCDRGNSKEARLAKEKLSETHLATLGQFIQIYAGAHDGKYPPDLESLRAVAKEWDRQSRDDAFVQAMTNPITGETPGYIYKKPAETEDAVHDKFKTPLLWESKDGQPDPAGAVLYADYQVERKQ